jgi:head-tail adaptor
MIIKELYEGIYKNIIKNTNYIDKLSEEIQISTNIKSIFEKNKPIIRILEKSQDIKLEKTIYTYVLLLLSSKNCWYSRFNQIHIFDNAENFSDIKEYIKKLMSKYIVQQMSNDNFNMKTNINIEEFPKKNKEQVEILLIQKETERIINKIIKYLHGIQEIFNHVNNNNIKSFLKRLEYMSNEEHDILLYQRKKVTNFLRVKCAELSKLAILDITEDQLKLEEELKILVLQVKNQPFIKQISFCNH